MPQLRPDLDRLVESWVGDRSGAGADGLSGHREIDVSVSLTGSSGVVLGRGERRLHYAASTMKLPVLLAVHRERDAGRLDLDERIGVHDDFVSQVGSSFRLEADDDSDDEVWDRMGQTVSLGWLCRRMIVRSSNLATDLVCERLGFAPVAEAVAACGEPASTDVRVRRMIGDFAAERAGMSNLVSTAGLAAVLTSLAAGRCAAPATCAEVLEVLAANEMGRDVRAGLPAGVWVAHKNGWVSDAVHDAALVRPDDAPEFVLCVATSGIWPDEADGHGLIAAVAGLVWSHRHSF